MIQGVLIFAFNNEQTDYLSMAEWSAGNIKRHLGLPVSVVTNTEYTGTDGCTTNINGACATLPIGWKSLTGS